MIKKCFFDTETTGLDCRVDALCSLSVIRDGDAKVKTWYFNPLMEVCPEASKVNGFTWDSLKQYPTFDKVAKEIFDYIDGCVMIGHNVAFDIGFLKSAFDKCGIQWNPKSICTKYEASKKLVCESYSLDSLTKHLGLDNLRETSHASDIDTLMCRALFEKLETLKREDEKFSALFDLREKIENAMKNGTVHITFRKTDGTLRPAKATLKTSVAKTGQHYGPAVVEYFDIDCNDWRSFNLTRLIEWHML